MPRNFLIPGKRVGQAVKVFEQAESALGKA